MTIKEFIEKAIRRAARTLSGVAIYYERLTETGMHVIEIDPPESYYSKEVYAWVDRTYGEAHQLFPDEMITISPKDELSLITSPMMYVSSDAGTFEEQVAHLTLPLSAIKENFAEIGIHLPNDETGFINALDPASSQIVLSLLGPAATIDPAFIQEIVVRATGEVIFQPFPTGIVEFSCHEVLAESGGVTVRVSVPRKPQWWNLNDWLGSLTPTISSLRRRNSWPASNLAELRPITA